MAEAIDLLIGLSTPVGRRKHKFNHIHQVAPMCPHGRAYWRLLANTTEPSVCGGDAVLCQITLTTCLICDCDPNFCSPPETKPQNRFLHFLIHRPQSRVVAFIQG